MRNFLFILGLLLVSAGAGAQQSLLIFMEASEKKPFYVRLATKTNASSATGQVYITEISSTGVEVFIGFPETEIPEQRFQITLRKNDNNFQLKQGGGQGWTLIDLESNQVIQPSGAPAKSASVISGIRKTDAFAIMMAGVVNDSAVLYTSAAIVEPVAEPATKAVAQAPKTPPSSTKPEPVPNNGLPIEPMAGDKNRVAAESKVSAKPVDSSLVQVKEEKQVAKKIDSQVSVTHREPTTSIDTAANQVTQTDLKKSETNATNPVLSRVKEADKKDSVVALTTKPDLPEKNEAVKLEPPVLVPSILKLSEKKSEYEYVLAYSDRGPDGKTDTIMISIPIEIIATPVKSPAGQQSSDSASITKSKPALSSSDTTSISKTKSAQTSPDTSATNRSKATEPAAATAPAGSAPATSTLPRKDSVWTRYQANPRPLSDTSYGKSNSTSKANPVSGQVTNQTTPNQTATNQAATNQPASNQPVSKSPSMVNSDCVNFATEYDLDKLRVRMVAEVSADERIASAKKIFRTKCFTTRQIRALTELFLNDEGKYKFLDTAYPFVSDSQEFRKLAEVLKDDYYVKRFNAMIRL